VGLEFVALTCDLFDGTEVPVTAGSVIFTPSSVVADADGHALITRTPVVIGLLGNPLPVVRLAATDSSGVTPSSWSWLVTMLGPGAGPPRSLLLLASDGPQQFLSELASA
jgi:hypothetical protein